MPVTRSPATRAPERVMILWCPDWPVVAARTAGSVASADADAPLAIIESGRVHSCSASARAEGVRRGLRLREAQARCPSLVVLPRRESTEAHAFEPVLAALEEVMPGSHPLRPGVCALRARGPAQFYGSEEEAALWVLDQVDALGVPGARVGVADGVFTAEHAARAAHPQRIRIVPPGEAARFLSPLPVGVLDDAALTGLLRRLGVYTLGEFAALPASSILDRFGPEGVRLHSLAAGLDSRPVVARVPPEELERRQDFEPPLDRVDQVAFGVRGLADRFLEGLVESRLVCTALRVEITSERGELSERTWLHPRSFTAAEVVDRVRWQLQGGSTETGLTSPVASVRVAPEAVDAIAHHEEGLWGAGPDARIHHALSRVQSMLGRTAVLTPGIGGGRAPADRTTLVAWGERMLHERAPDPPWPGRLPDPAPTRVFEPPHPVTVFDEAGREVTIESRGALSASPAIVTGARGTLRVTAWAGPWTSHERWWAGGTPAHRIQFVDQSGTAWLLVRQHDTWWAEGSYD